MAWQQYRPDAGCRCPDAGSGHLVNDGLAATTVDARHLLYLQHIGCADGDDGGSLHEDVYKRQEW